MCQFIGTVAFSFYKNKAGPSAESLRGSCLQKVSELVDGGDLTALKSNLPQRMFRELGGRVKDGTLAAELLMLSEDTTVNLSGREDLPSLPPALPSSTTALDASNTSISDLSTLAGLTRLTSLNLSGCPRVSPESLALLLDSDELPQLKRLHLPPGPWNDPDWVDRFLTRKLVAVFPPEGCPFGAEAMSKLRETVASTVVSVPGHLPVAPEDLLVQGDGGSLDSDAFSASDLSGLQQLEVWVGVSAPGALACLASAEQLRVLSVNTTGFDPSSGLENELHAALSATAVLEELSLACDAAGSPVILSCLPASLRVLRLNGMRHFVPAAQRVSPDFPDGLRVASFASLSSLSLEGVRGLCRTAGELAELVFVDLVHAAEALLPLLSSNTIRYLELNGCGDWDEEEDTGVTSDPCWAAAVGSLPSLCSLLLYGTPPITVPDLQVLRGRLTSLSCPTSLLPFSSPPPANPATSTLRYFNIGMDSEVTSEGVTEVLKSLQGLTTLQLEFCENVSREVSLKDFEGLTEVTLRDLPLSDAQLAASLVGATGIRTLILDSANIGPLTVATVSSLPFLTTLSIFASSTKPLLSLSSASLRVLFAYPRSDDPSKSFLQVPHALAQSCPHLVSFHTRCDDETAIPPPPRIAVHVERL